MAAIRLFGCGGTWLLVFAVLRSRRTGYPEIRAVPEWHSNAVPEMDDVGSCIPSILPIALCTGARNGGLRFQFYSASRFRKLGRLDRPGSGFALHRHRGRIYKEKAGHHVGHPVLFCNAATSL